MTKKTKKRYYRVDEVVWVHELKKEATVKSIDIPNKDVVVEIDGDLKTLKLWEIDKLKYKAKDKFFKDNPDKTKTKKKKKKTQKYNPVIAKGELMLDSNPKVQLMLPVIDPKAEMNNFSNFASLSKALESINERINSIMNPEVFFAKVSENAIIPTKREEDAGYDFYTPVEHLVLKKGQTTLVPTGIASALPKTHYLNTKHERGSTGKLGMNVLAGVVDSGYRGEIFIAITPLDKDVILSNEVTEVTDKGEYVMYPVSKAIAQATIDLVPNAVVKEISFDELQKIESLRGDTKLGQSGK